MRKWFVLCALAVAAVAMPARSALAQVTTSSMTGIVTGDGGAGVASASIRALHTPSGTAYTAQTRGDGRFNIPGMRVGGPYTVEVRAIGYEPAIQQNIILSLGVAVDLRFELKQVIVQLGEITVTEAGELSSTRTGAATRVTSEALATLPTINRTIQDFTRLTPQSSGNSFGGQDARFNNITIDGSFFNNSFGLGSVPGQRTGVSPLPLDAIDQIQVNIAPYDVRQGYFVGAGVNAVTKSGTNEFKGTFYRIWRNDNLVGTNAAGRPVNPGTFDFGLWGGAFSGPIVKDKLFFFVNVEDDGLSSPFSTFRPNAGGEAVSGNTTRVLRSDLEAVSSFLRNNFNYETGPFENWSLRTPARRVTAKLDFNAGERSKFSLRYTHLDSESDIPVSNSGSLGFPNRRDNLDAFSYQNSAYGILENIRSIVGEWNLQVGRNMANQLIVGYTENDESRNPKGTFFPLIDILNNGTNYISAGFEPFTPNNELRYKTWQIQNSFTIYGNKHDVTFGVVGQKYNSENVFFPGSQSVYVYNSLQDFFDDANGFLLDPNRTTSPVNLRRFQVRFNNIPGQEKPIQPLEVYYAGGYLQDEYRVNDRLKVTTGIRVDIPFFSNTAFTNPQANALTFRDENGNPVRYDTGRLPDVNPLFSPRFGFNWDLTGDRSTQIRGGTGIFTGPPPFVWISNQVGNNGILTGFQEIDNTTTRPFNPNPDAYKPTNVTGAPAATYELALTEPGYRFPQLWRSNFAIDQKLPWGIVGTAEFLYSRDVNGTYYINANQAAPLGNFTGVDQRERFAPSTAGRRVNPNITSAIVLKNQSEGYSYNIAASLEKAFQNGLFAKFAYSYGVSKNLVDPGSIAFGSWNGNPHTGDANNPGLGFSSFSPGHRWFLALSYRKEYFKFGATTFSFFGESRNQANLSYVFGGDANFDGGTSNDLLYIPRDQSEMNFQQFTASGRTFTAAEQAAAWDAFIESDPYLRSRRGQYAERNAAFLPMVFRADVSAQQELFQNLGGKRNTLSFRVDILNFFNLLNGDWGVGNQITSLQPLVIPTAAQGGPVDANGALRYRMRTINNELVTQARDRSANLGDVYRIQFSLRYTFN